MRTGGTEHFEASDVFWKIQNTFAVVNQRKSKISFAIGNDCLAISDCRVGLEEALSQSEQGLGWNPLSPSCPFYSVFLHGGDMRHKNRIERSMIPASSL